MSVPGPQVSQKEDSGEMLRASGTRAPFASLPAAARDAESAETTPVSSVAFAEKGTSPLYPQPFPGVLLWAL